MDFDKIAHHCDFGDSIDFDCKASKYGFLKVYESPAMDFKKLHEARIDGDTNEWHSEQTALTKCYYNTQTKQYYYKFGCVFIGDSRFLENCNKAQCLKIVRYFFLKYACKHFSEDILDSLANGYYKNLVRMRALTIHKEA